LPRLSGHHPTRKSITPIPVPAGLNPRRVALGDQLFHDPRLSHDNTLSCGSCHDTSTNGASANARDRGANGSLLPFNTPTVFNAALNFRLTWEGNVRTLEHEAEGGLRSPAIMGSSAEEAVAKISADAGDGARDFRDAYGHASDASRPSGCDCHLRALAANPGRPFRSLACRRKRAPSVPRSSPVTSCFKSVGCIFCHQGVNVGGNLFQRHGVFRALGTAEPELVSGFRACATSRPRRLTSMTASAETLNEAVRQMGLAQLDRALSDLQVGSIVAFLGTLTGTYRDRSVMPASAGPSAETVPQ